MKNKKERTERKDVMNTGKVRARELQREGNRRRARNGKKKRCRERVTEKNEGNRRDTAQKPWHQNRKERRNEEMEH